VISGERRQALCAERGLAPAYGSARSTDVGLHARQCMRLHDILSARTDIPRAPSVAAGDLRVHALVPRGVRLAAVPAEVGRIYPRFSRDRVFIGGDKIVIVNPRTSRIVAVLPSGSIEGPLRNNANRRNGSKSSGLSRCGFRRAMRSVLWERLRERCWQAVSDPSRYSSPRV
jgi:hypothetical protein